MKIQSFTTRSGVIVSGLLMGALLATAQPNPDPRPERRPIRPDGPAGTARPEFGEGFRPQMGAQQLAGMMHIVRVLTPEQRESFRATMQQQREKSRALEEKLREAREAVFAAGLDREFNEGAVRRQAMKVAELEADLMVLRAKGLSQIEPPLTREQIEQIKNPPPFQPGQFRGEGRRGEEMRGPSPAGPRGEGRNQERPRAPRPPPERDENDLPPRR